MPDLSDLRLLLVDPPSVLVQFMVAGAEAVLQLLLLRDVDIGQSLVLALVDRVFDEQPGDGPGLASHCDPFPQACNGLFMPLYLLDEIINIGLGYIVFALAKKCG